MRAKRDRYAAELQAAGWSVVAPDVVVEPTNPIADVVDTIRAELAAVTDRGLYLQAAYDAGLRWARVALVDANVGPMQRITDALAVLDAVAQVTGTPPPAPAPVRR